MKKTFLLILITMWVAVAHSQQNRKNDIGTLSGTVYSGTENAPLQNATLQLYQLPDTVYRTGMSSSTDGRFTFSVASGEYLLRLSYVGFLPQDKKVTVVANKNTDVGRIVLSDDVVALKEALVTAEASQITMSEDTTIYNTSAFRVPPGSMLEELIKKYPGVEVAEDGTITINGKTVNRILMKGKDFYGTDKNAALKNIPVDIVDKVKFYDKQSDFTRLTG
ncbi:MAG: carboxypeptidase-like regulatory domain-containing protein, partial [Bacteroidaceae bacterium]|nr:carboxypeptidase-like regulatory domain-containing protein [Bacteroidaceae bacterium]